MRLAVAAVLTAACTCIALAQGNQLAVPVAPAEITTTIPPSTTTPDEISPKPVPPSNVPPRARSAPIDQSNADNRSQAQSITSPSITRPDVPTASPPNKRALCYEKQVFNPNSYEYEWQQFCD